MENTLSFALKSLMQQVADFKPNEVQSGANADAITISQVRDAAEEAKDALRHNFRR